GEETTKLATYVSGAIWLSSVLPVGSARFTQAIATRLRLPLPVAEELKIWHGHCDPQSIDGSELLEMPEVAGVTALLPRSEVAAALAEEAERCAADLRRWLDEVRRSAVEPEALLLAGGGALLPGLDTLLMQALDLPVQRGIPVGIHGLPALLEGPAYATVAGLVLWYARYAADENLAVGARRRALPKMMQGLRSLM